jgi:hypothetical protein
VVQVAISLWPLEQALVAQVVQSPCRSVRAQLVLAAQFPSVLVQVPTLVLTAAPWWLWPVQAPVRTVVAASFRWRQALVKRGPAVRYRLRLEAAPRLQVVASRSVPVLQEVLVCPALLLCRLARRQTVIPVSSRLPLVRAPLEVKVVPSVWQSAAESLVQAVPYRSLREQLPTLQLMVALSRLLLVPVPEQTVVVAMYRWLRVLELLVLAAHLHYLLVLALGHLVVASQLEQVQPAELVYPAL